jgi:ABC-2 type transport system ATP-binding protein
MIEARNLTKHFDDFVAVDAVDFDVKAGEVLALLGPNGAGKTTTVRMLTSVLRPTRGYARVAGFDVVTDAAQVRGSVGVLTEHHGLYGRMQAEEYLDFFGQLYGLAKNERYQRSETLLNEFNLWQVRHRRIGEFSKGMRQKLALTRAMLHNPPVLLLDEPTSAMDPDSARLVRNAIKSLRSAERALIICTHNLAEAEELADQIAIIRRGKIIVYGTPSHLKHTLLGPREYQIHLPVTFNDILGNLPPEIEICAQGAGWIRYRTATPAMSNPQLLRALLGQGLAVIKLEELPRSLEQVYLEAINTFNE